MARSPVNQRRSEVAQLEDHPGHSRPDHRNSEHGQRCPPVERAARCEGLVELVVVKRRDPAPGGEPRERLAQSVDEEESEQHDTCGSGRDPPAGQLGDHQCHGVAAEAQRGQREADLEDRADADRLASTCCARDQPKPARESRDEGRDGVAHDALGEPSRTGDPGGQHRLDQAALFISTSGAASRHESPDGEHDRKSSERPPLDISAHGVEPGRRSQDEREL